MSEAKAIGGKNITAPILMAAAVAVIAALFLVKRFVFGLGSMTNMSDGYPWGIWIAYDVVVGTAIACGGYSMALLVYVANKGKYHPLVRPALMASVFGYTLAGLSIMFDVGRYWQAYNLFLPWYINPNSVMFEVAFCVTTYIFVLWIEFFPVFVEKAEEMGLKVEGIKKILDKLIFLFIAIGVLLPTMHQSSLGSLLLLAGHKVHPLWQTGMLPLLYLLTAITMGYAIVIAESAISAKGFKREMETDLLSGISKLIPYLLIAYLAFRFGDILVRGQLGAMFSEGFQSVMFWVENMLFAIPVAILLQEKNRSSGQMLFISAVSMLMAGSLLRFNGYLIGFDPGPGWSYFPSVGETMVTLAIISAEIAAYILFVKNLPVLPKLGHS